MFLPLIANCQVARSLSIIFFAPPTSESPRDLSARIFGASDPALVNQNLANTAFKTITTNGVTKPLIADENADISVVNTDSPDPVAEGQMLTYQILVQNNGLSKVPEVKMNDVLSTTLLTFISAVSVPQGTCIWTSPNLDCNLGTLGGGSVITVTVTTTVKPVGDSLPKTASNTATVSSGKTDPNPANNFATISTQILPAADLQITLSCPVTSVQTGNSLTFLLQVTNAGPSIADHVVVTDTLPVELTYLSSSRTPASAASKVVWNLGTLGVDQSASFTLEVEVKSPTKILVNYAAVGSSMMDGNLSNSQTQSSVIAVDAIAPTAAWKLPVTLGQSYVVVGQVVHLEVLATDNVAVSYVKFYRWNEPAGSFVDIGIDYSAATCQSEAAELCFQWGFDTRVLNPGWNEIRARAYDESGNASPRPDLNSHIWLYYNPDLLYLPFVKK